MRDGHRAYPLNTGEVVTVTHPQDSRFTQLTPEWTVRVEEVEHVNAIGARLPRSQCASAVRLWGGAELARGFVADAWFIEGRIYFDTEFMAERDTVFPRIELR